MSRGRDAAAGRPAWDEVSLLAGRAGIRWWAAVLLAFGLSAAGVFADLQRIDRLGLIFQACYFAGCLLAVCLVQRRGLFGPMVQPPLLLALAVPGVVLLAGGAPNGGGLTSTALAVGTPLINGFPTMAITTGATLALGAYRLFTQRRPATDRRRDDDRRARDQSGAGDDGSDDRLDEGPGGRLDRRPDDEYRDPAGDGRAGDDGDGRRAGSGGRAPDERRRARVDPRLDDPRVTGSRTDLRAPRSAAWDTGDVEDPDDGGTVRSRRRRP